MSRPKKEPDLLDDLYTISKRYAATLAKWLEAKERGQLTETQRFTIQLFAPHLKGTDAAAHTTSGTALDSFGADSECVL